MTKLIFGCGYLGQRVARAWSGRGDHVWAVTRNVGRAEQFRQAGWSPLVADVTRPETLNGLPTADIVLFAVGFDRSAGLEMHRVYVEGLASVLRALPEDVGRLVYISSTGVYGQNDGSWVDENSLCVPIRDGGKACLAAEDLLRRHPLGARSVILRLAGIYGPGRIPRKKDVAQGKVLPSAARGYLNLIHVDDAVDIILAAEQLADLPGLFVVSDGHPVSREDYYAELARQLGINSLPTAPPPAGSSAAERARGNKRVRSDRIRRELDISLRYPNYRVGLAAIRTAAAG